MTLTSDLSFVVNFIIFSLKVCMKLHLYPLHFSSDLDNTWYRKSPRTKLCWVSASFVKNGTVKATFFVKVVVTPNSERWEGPSEELENGDEGRHGTVRCVQGPGEADTTNRPLLPSETPVPVPPHTPKRITTPSTFSHEHRRRSIKTKTNVFMYVYVCVCVCMYVYVCVCMYVSIYINIYFIYIPIYLYISTYLTY
jgi:hypothetical protein